MTVDQLCRSLAISRVTLTRYASLYGVTPVAPIRRIKTDVAKRLLRDTKQSITQISASVGYSEHSKFSKFFKRETGKTPTEFRDES